MLTRGLCLANLVVDHSIYGELLEKYVENGVVDYRGFKNDEVKLDQYLEVLDKVDPERLDRNDQFAFYVNAYNAWTIKLILTRYPDLKSIKELGSIFKSPWKKKIARKTYDNCFYVDSSCQALFWITLPSPLIPKSNGISSNSLVTQDYGNDRIKTVGLVSK